MGTRHRQVVINSIGETKIDQYGQWDGYPSGQGIEILEFLRTCDFEKYEQNLNKIRKATQEDIDLVNESDNWKIDYPYLHRDCGSDIHKMIQDGVVKFVQFLGDENSKWCEGFYYLNLKDRTFQVDYYDSSVTFSLDNLPTNEDFLKEFESEED